MQKTQEHLYFLRHSTLNRSFREGFWLHATERFYYLHEFMEQYQKKHVFHLESDNMLYANLQKILPVFTTHYTEKIGATFDNDARCIPGFMYISGVGVLYDLISFMLQKTESAYNDMRIISLFKNEFPEHIKQLPITCKQYAKDRQLKSKKNHCTKNPKHYYQHYDEFEGIFDAAALGQYLGGQDPRNGPCQPGFINESCLFDPSHFSFIWQKDRHERNVPYLVYKNKKYKIINLHIHSKKLALYSSL
ncbi:hypothetical protein KC460_03275 [Candidatus Dependentiae bacterium]|nr:hypothetical protein [Candidatus Dependentiae bacterium]